MAQTPCVVELAELSAAVYEASGDARVDLRRADAAVMKVPLAALAKSAVNTMQGTPARPPWSTTPATVGIKPAIAPAADGVAWQRGSAWANLLGFYAALFERNDCSKVLVFRGTDDAWDAVLDDAAIALSGGVVLPLVPPQILPALSVARGLKLRDGDFVAGHSLGGALALLVACQLGLPAVTFNAPGVRDVCIAASPLAGLRFFKALQRCWNNPRVLNIRTDYDPVSSFVTTGAQAGGGRTTLAVTACGLDGLCRHSIRTCISEVRKDPKYYDPLKL